MITEEQRAERINYIGSSDSPAVLGISRWKTPLAVWAEKTGNVVPEDISDRLPVKLGNKLEQTVAELFMEETGFKVRRVNETLYHPRHPFLACNIDRRVVGSNALVECKTASAWKAKEWAGEDIPNEYVAQVMHALMVSGYKEAYLAVLIGNQDFKVKFVQRNDAVIAQMERKLVHFWNTYVVPKEMPMVLSPNDSETLYQLFPMESPGDELILGDELDQLIESRAALLADKKSIESILEKTENEIKALLKTAERAKTSTNIVSWKAQKQRRIDTKLLQAEQPAIYDTYSREIGMRVLRIRHAKE